MRRFTLFALLTVVLALPACAALDGEDSDALARDRIRERMTRNRGGDR